MRDIKELREEINNIDASLADLFTKRMEVAKEIGEYKKANGLPIFDAIREKEVIDKNSKLIKDESIKGYYINFLKEVMKESKNYQDYLSNGLKVAYSGVPGAFSHIASRKMYPNSSYISYPDFESAYKACQNGDVDIAILPVENSFQGDVGSVMDLLFQGDLHIINMFDLDIHQNLIGVKGSNIKDIKKVISHPQALGQAREYLLKGGYELIEEVNTSIAAKKVAELNDPSVACVASQEVAEIYDLEILEKDINTKNNNSTRFAALSKIERNPDENVKMGEHFILVYTVKNTAGSLAEALNIIGAHNFNMRTLRSRPMKDLLWNYFFFVEVDGNINSRDGKDLLCELKTVCDRLKVVGSYYDYKDK